MGEDRTALDEADRERLVAMVRNARRAMAWAADAGPEWARDEKTAAAVALVVGQIGENSVRIADATRARASGSPWREISAMRNVLYHADDTIRPDVLARTVSQDLPRLVKQLEALLARGGPDVREGGGRYRSRPHRRTLRSH